MKTEYRDPKRNADGITVDVDINHPQFGWIPFTASPNDPEPHGRELHARVEADAASGMVQIEPYVPPPPPTTEELAALARRERDARLQASDWSQLMDVPEATRAEWATYRQALRDVPLQPGFPETIEWPTEPSSGTREVE